MSLTPKTLSLSPEAKREWIMLHNAVEQEMGPWGEFMDVRDFAAKTADNAARIAANFWMLEHGEGDEIDRKTMLAGAAVASWHLHEAKRILNPFAKPQVVSDAMLLESWLLKNDGTKNKPRDILNGGPNRLRDKSRRDAAIKFLADKNRLFVTETSNEIQLHPNLTGGVS